MWIFANNAQIVGVKLMVEIVLKASFRDFTLYLFQKHFLNNFAYLGSIICMNIFFSIHTQ